MGLYYKTYCKILETISKECFFPIPKVDACIVEITPRQDPPFSISDEDFFFDLTKTLFNHRRKKIKNILEERYQNLDEIPYLNNRVEELKPEQIGELSNILIKKNIS